MYVKDTIASGYHPTLNVTAQKKPVTTMLTYPWKCTVLHCNHLGNAWKPLVLMTRHFDYCPSASEGDNQSVRSSAPVVSRCFPGGYNVKLYISRGRLAWWLLAFLHSACPKHLLHPLIDIVHGMWGKGRAGELRSSRDITAWWGHYNGLLAEYDHLGKVSLIWSADIGDHGQSHRTQSIYQGHLLIIVSITN